MFWVAFCRVQPPFSCNRRTPDAVERCTHAGKMMYLATAHLYERLHGKDRDLVFSTGFEVRVYMRIVS